MIARCQRRLRDGCLDHVILDRDEQIAQEDGTLALIPPDPTEGQAPDWYEDPRGDGLVCRACMTPDERAEQDNDLARHEIETKADHAADEREG